jgi:hypothetical protein
MKLHQLLPIIQKVKDETKKVKTTIYQAIQKRDNFEGLSRTYSPINDDGYVYPSEGKPVITLTKIALKQFAASQVELFDTCYAQDKANQEAKADIIVDGEVILANVPITHLLFLEKQIDDIKTFLEKIPTLDATEEWVFNDSLCCYESTAKKTTKTKKITKPVVLYEATKEHPAQVKEVSEDIIEGTWNTIKRSGAYSYQSVVELRNKVIALEKAILEARERANQIDVKVEKASSKLLTYLFN